MSTHLQSKSLNNRIHSLDLLRGFAVLGILIMNITNFSHVNVAYMNPAIGAGLEGYNQYFHAFNYIFADTRFMSIFSILFGAGVVFSWGYITNSKKVFPHNLIKKVINGNNEVNSKLNTMWAKKVIDGGYILHFRHAQREKWDDVTAFDAYELLFNIKAENSSFKKAVCLTKQGIEEAKLIKNIFNSVDVQISEIISSPSCRARQTALIAFDSINKITNSLLHRTAMTKNQHNDFAIQLREIIDNLEIVDGKNIILSGHGGTLS